MNCLLTISVGEIYGKIAKLTHPTFKAYAKKMGADFVCIDKSSLSTPHWEKFTQIFNLLNKYERIIYLDSDVIVRDDCPDLFKIVPKEQLGLFDEMPFTSQRNLSLIDSCKDYGITLRNWNGRYYNTGVMVVSRQHKELFKKPQEEKFSFYEQGYFNANLAKVLENAGNELSVFDLPYQFNRMTCMDQFTGEERFASYIIHYAGYPGLTFVLDIIEKDLEKWKKDKGNYKYQRHLLVDVQGGLGDQLCTEPVLRFMQKYVYPNDDINVVTHFPQMFRHLNSNIKVWQHGEFARKFDVPYYHICTLPGPTTLMWSCVSGMMSHSVDYSSMAILKRILPNDDKRIKIEVGVEDIAGVVEAIGIRNLNDLVLVHPGRHWESKTFPVKWWQELICGLSSKMQVCIIGKDEKTRGTVDIKIPTGAIVIDARNLLSLKELVALISSARVLISNDSAPIHIAGAFDNGIILIPTCKHPDHILPYRYGTQTYKAKALYKKLMCFEYESAPTAIYGSSAHYLPSDFSNYLPDTNDVIEEAMSLYGKEK